jgi:serine protease
MNPMILILILSFNVSQVVHTPAHPDGEVDPAVRAEALVQLHDGRQAHAQLERLGVVPLRELLPTRNLWRVRGRGDGRAVALALQRHPEVAWAEPDLYLRRRRFSMSVPPDDPRYPGQWYLDRVAIERAWSRSTGSEAVTIQIVDNGCDPTHPDLALLPGLDLVDGDGDPAPTDDGNHGTACAGVAAAVGGNGVGIAGACPRCRVRCVRLLGGDDDRVPISADVEAMRFALDHPDVAVISNSWGFTEPIPTPRALRLAIEEVSTRGRGGKGALVVFAAGNQGRLLRSDELYSLPELLTVGAVNNFDEAAPFSNRGADVDLTAPTGSLTLDLTGAAGESPDDYTALFGGTSAACPLVAGIAGLLFSARPELTAAEVREALVATVKRAPFASPGPGGHDPIYGFGIVDPGAALDRLEPPPIDPPASAPAGCAGAPLWLLTALRRRRRS